MAASPRYRYSTANVEESSSAQQFSWETPVPINPFWDSFSYSLARNFLVNFSDHEYMQLPIDPNSAASHENKVALLLKLLEAKLETENLATSPQSLYEADYSRWDTLWLGIYTIQMELKLPEAEQTIQMLVDRRPDKSNKGPLHMLADHFFGNGEYAKAEETERTVCAWMDAHERLGRDSPQALSARRFLVKTLWMQGTSRRAEAHEMIAEINSIIDGMATGNFGVYQEEEVELMRQLVDELQAADVR